MKEKIVRENPKLKGSNMISARTQIGQCPLNCLECYFNNDNYYEDKTKQNLPHVEDTIGKIVRCNDGNDSNINMPEVLHWTRQYRDVFYNTSIGKLYFDRPTVLTINGRDTDYTFIKPNDIVGDFNTLMAIRFRINVWNRGLCESAINLYRAEGIHSPFLLTIMRYSNYNNI